MNKEIAFLNINQAYGGDQDWLPRPMMRLGGCSTVCACHAAACLAQWEQAKGGLYPYDDLNISRDQFVDFAVQMYRYVYPGLRGMPKLSMFCDSFNRYAASCQVSVKYQLLPGSKPVMLAKDLICRTIDRGLPLQFLQLKHRDKQLDDLTWHWFTVTGYGDDEPFKIIYANGGQRCQVELARLWDSGYREKGGLLVIE